MKSRAFTLFGIILTGFLACLIYTGQAERLWIGATSNTARTGPIRVSESRNDSQPPSRFAGLTPELRRIVVRLEEANRKWNDARIKGESAHKEWNDWQEFSRESISVLDTNQIHALVEWLE